MADIKFAFVACAILSLFLNGCAQRYEAQTVESRANNWQATRSRLRGRAATRSVATSPRDTLDNSSPDITTRSRQRTRSRYIPESLGEEVYRYETSPDPILIERNLNFRSRTNIKTLEDSLNTERYQKKLERPQRRNGFVETTDVPFPKKQNDVGTPGNRLERMRSRIAAERRSDGSISHDSRPRSRGRTIYQDATVADVTEEAKISRTREHTSRYQNVELAEPAQREFTVQTEPVKQESGTSVPAGRFPPANRPPQIVSDAPLLPPIYDHVPGSKPQQVDAVFPNLSTQHFSTDPSQQLSRKSDTPTVPADAASNQRLDSGDAERPAQFILLQTQKGRNRGRATYRTAQEGSPGTSTQSRSTSRQGSFRSRTRVTETTSSTATPSIRSRTQNVLQARTFRGKTQLEAGQEADDRIFIENSQPESPKPENSSRGNTREIKASDEIDESANYPKEFLEKLKRSKSYTPSTKVTYRSKRRQYLTTRTPPTKLHEDTSEPSARETHEELSLPKDKYSQEFYKKPLERSKEPRQESGALEVTESVVEERRKFVPKKKLSAEERKERISRLKEKFGKNETEDGLKAEESKESIVKESLVTQANTHPGSREVLPTEKVKSSIEVKLSVSSNVKRVKKPRGQVKFRDDDKDLIPLGSEEQLVVLKNETTTTTTTTTTPAAKKPATTKIPTTTKKPPTTTTARLPRRVASAAGPTATTQATTSTTKGDFAVLNVTLFPSTRHRFSARINSSAEFSFAPDTEPVITTTRATPLSTPKGFPSLEKKPELTLSVNKLFNTSVTSTNSSTSITMSTTLKPSTTSPTMTTRTTTRRSNSKKKSSGKKKSKKSKTNRTTTKKPKSPRPSTTTVRPASNSTGVRPLILAFSDIETIINETVKIVNNNSMTGPSPGVVPRSELNALTPETILNGTTEATMGMGDAPTTTVRANTNSSVNSTNKVELPARLTEVECANGNCTKSKSQSVYFNEDNFNREPIPYSRQRGTTKSPDNLRKIFIFGVFPNNTVQRKPFPGDGGRFPAKLHTHPTTTSLPPYTSADYYVFGVYPNNSVVRRRGWKTFDYEKYHSPYVIFGIYPNNTIIKKFPNGTTINDKFMVSDNEIHKSDGKIYCACANPVLGGRSPHVSTTSTAITTTTTTTTTTITTTSTSTPTEEPEEEGEDNNDDGDDEEEEEEEEKPDRNPKDEVETVDVESEGISENEESTERTTEGSTPAAEIMQTTLRILEKEEEADLVSTTTESTPLEDAEEADLVSTTTESTPLEDAEEADLVSTTTESTPLEDAEEADLVSTTTKSTPLEDAEEADLVSTTTKSTPLEDAEKADLVSTTTKSTPLEDAEEADLISTTTESTPLEDAEEADLVSTTTKSTPLEDAEEADLISTTTESTPLEDAEEADLISTTTESTPLEDAEEADLISQTTESDRLEDAEEADNASTPRGFDDSSISSLEREETQNAGLEGTEVSDSKASGSLSNGKNADGKTTERSNIFEGKATEDYLYSREKSDNEKFEERTEENERLQEGTTENTKESLRNEEVTEDTPDRSEFINERTTEESVNEEERTEKNKNFNEEREEGTSERSAGVEEKTTARKHDESTTEGDDLLEERTENYLTKPWRAEKKESLEGSTEEGTTERGNDGRGRFDVNESSATERSGNFEDDSEFGTTQRSVRPEDQAVEYSYEPGTTETSEPTGAFEAMKRSQSAEAQTEGRYFEASTTERSGILYGRTDAYELSTERSERVDEGTTERSENIKEQTSPEPFEDGATERTEDVQEQTFGGKQFHESYEPKTTERISTDATTKESERPQMQETGTEQTFLAESPKTARKPSAGTQRLEVIQTEGNFHSTDEIVTQTDPGRVAAAHAEETGSLQSLSVTTRRFEENATSVKVIYEGNLAEYGTPTEATPQRIVEMAAEDLREIEVLKGLSVTTGRPLEENTIPVKVIYDGYWYEEPTGKPFTFEDAFAKSSDPVADAKTAHAVTTSAMETTTEDAKEPVTADYEIDVRDLGSLISRLTMAVSRQTTPPTDREAAVAATSREKTINLLDALLPLSIEYVQASASENQVKKRHRKSLDDLDEPSGLTNLAYRSLSSSETTSTPIPILTTTRTSTTTTTTTTTTKVSPSTSATRFKPKKVKNYSKTSVTAYKHLTNLTSTPRPEDVFIVTPVGSLKGNRDADYLKRGKVKFVTLTPGVVVTTNIHDENDILTMSSQHVQKVTKAPAKIPDNFLSTVFGELEEKTSSPIPDILKNVENDLQGDGLSASLARRIITLALEKAMTSTTPVPGLASQSITTTTTSPSPTTTTSKQRQTFASTHVTTTEPTTTTKKLTTTKKPTTTRRPRTTSTTTTTTTTTASETEQTREILITPKKTQGQVSKRPAPIITSPEFLQSTVRPEISDGRTAVEVPVALEPLNVLFSSDRLSSTTTATPKSPKPTEDLNVLLPELFQEQTPSSSKVPDRSNLIAVGQKSTKDKASIPKRASAVLSESDLKILEAILQQQGANGGGQNLERIVQNQIRLAEEVRKASRNLRKKPRTTTTTTTTTTERPTPLGLGFLLNLFGSGSRSNGPGLFADDARNFRRQRPTTPPPTFITLTNTSYVPPDPYNELDSEGTATGDRSVRGELVSAAIDVTKAVSKFMGTVLSSAAQSFQNFFRNLGR